MTRHTGRSTSNLAQIKKNKQVKNPVSGSKPIEFIVKEYKNLEMDVITIPEPKLFNILKDWEEQREKQFQIRKRKIEKISMLISVFSIAITLWITYFTATFEKEFEKALCFFFSVLSALVLIVCIILSIKAYSHKEKDLNLNDLIKSIEKRTE